MSAGIGVHPHRGDLGIWKPSSGQRNTKVTETAAAVVSYATINKIFTAVAVTQLVQAGSADLTAPVGTYLTDYPNRDVAAKVTIHHLLTHTAGTGDIFVPEYMERRERVRIIADYLALLGQRGPEFEPGARSSYSNYGYILLGAVIEKVSGQSYYDYVDEHVFKPAGIVYGIRVFGAAGVAPGMSGDLTIYPDSGYINGVRAGSGRRGRGR